MRKQITLTPEEGKRLIAKTLTEAPFFREALTERTVVIVAGTTGGHIAREALKTIGVEDFDARGFMRGVMRPPRDDRETPPFPGDVVICRGEWRRGLTIFDAADALGRGDIIVKGANAVHLATRTAGVLIGSDVCGTILPAIQAAVGRRARLILATGIEKRVEKPIYELAALVNAADTEGLRLFPVPGEIYTEMDSLAAYHPELIAAGGVDGWEGLCRFLVDEAANIK